ncbi:Trafficking protein particle complex subunit 10 [Desmophyllum pertusum]|uniref:Trafficking protein particle complex subunit 10 n=1 Tax=Desmophyllum pertusum TaxID=174260 RepID=A0A9X0A6H6_9CNID|nr:Trafficking protein particle complex subunit 10 [Desmophyllum pertusum]
MLGLFEEALIQYDEIDALLTQLVINSNHGEPLDCIEVFMRDCNCCDGVSLAKSSQDFLRQLIKTHEANYVDLRNYLFSRQCNLLLKMDRRAWEIAQRTLDFLHNLIHELAMKEVKFSMPTGGASCCIILTSLEVLKTCENECDKEDMVYSLHFALLYQYARQKLDDLGTLCALMPDMTPDSSMQTICTSLSDGIGKTQGSEDLEPNSPSKRLQRALSSRLAFQSLYLELTDRAITIFKNIGRARAAKVLGVDLAQFFRVSVSMGSYLLTLFVTCLKSLGCS